MRTVHHARRETRWLLAAGLAVAAFGACAPDPNVTMDMAQSIFETQDAVLDMRAQMADMQAQMDSMRTFLEHQDSVIRNIANLTGNPLPAKPMTTIPPPSE